MASGLFNAALFDSFFVNVYLLCDRHTGPQVVFLGAKLNECTVVCLWCIVLP